MMTNIVRALPVAVLLVLVGCDGCAEPPAKVDFSDYLKKHSPAIELTGRVIDAANVLSPAEEASLTGKLQELEQQTNHQLVIVTSPSLGGKDIASYTRELANRWGIGRKGVDDGVVLLVAPNEKQVRIAVGRGLERTLTPALCQKIINNEMIPRFRKTDYAGGVEAGLNSLTSLLQ